MTTLSHKSKAEFYAVAKSLLPWDTLFDPADYLEEFRRAYGKLSPRSFRKYMALMAKDPQFSAVGRARDSANSSYYYFLDSSESKIVEKDSPSNPLLPNGVSDESLEIFASRVRSVIRGGQWYTVNGLRRKYHANKFRKLSKKTFSYYISLVCRGGLWEGLERDKRGVRGSYMYRWSRPDLKGARWESDVDDTVTVTPVPAQTSPRSIEYVCKSCEGISPCGAKFCMHCGARVEPTYIRTVVQELVTHVPLELEGLTSSQVSDYLKKWVMDRVHIVIDTGESGEPVALVSIGKRK
jgi:hypothetical protein